MSQSTAKTRIDPQAALAYLKETISPGIAVLLPVEGGETSQAFGFDVDDQHYILRVNTDDSAFRKDAYAATHFASADLPIPQVLHLDIMQSGHFACVTPRAAGELLNLLSAGTRNEIMPKVMAMLDAIHQSHVVGHGYGVFDTSGDAASASWRDALQDELAGNRPHWDRLSATTCLEADVLLHLLSSIADLVPHMPNLRQLVHGDIGMDNTLADETGITAVIDWGGARYGDPIYDIAWLHVWWQDVPFSRLYREHRMRDGTDIDDFDARLTCYASFIGLSALAFFANSNQPGKYRWLRERLASIGLLGQ